MPMEQNGVPKPLRVIVVGAGIGGPAALTAAIALRREGHIVEIFENSRFADEVGAAIAIPPNGARILQRLGVDLNLMRGVEWQGLVLYSCDNSEKKLIEIPAAPGPYPYSLLVHRVDYHKILKEVALSKQGDGEPAKLYLQSSVESCNTEEGIITLKNGETHEGDVIIGADGIRSTIRTSVLGKSHVAPASHISAFRWLVDSSKFKDDPKFSWVLGEGPQGPRQISEAKDGAKAIFSYPCRDKDLFNIATIFNDEHDQDSVEWTVPATREAALKEFSDYDPKFIEFIKLAENVKIWQMRSLGPLDTWIRGRTCLLGDAAHAMLPTLGQGVAQAVEDAISLATLLPHGVRREDVPRRLELYQDVRKMHVEFLQKYSLEKLLAHTTRFAGVEGRQTMSNALRHDAVQAARDVLAKELASASG